MAPSGPAGYTFCARQGEHCRITGTATVAYGGPVVQNGHGTGSYSYVYRKGVSSGINCKDDLFPAFPYPDETVSKACFVKDERDHRGSGVGGQGGGPAGYTKCAEQGEMCHFRGTADIAFGDSGAKLFIYKEAVVDGIKCDRSAFPNGNISNLVAPACYMKLRLSPPATIAATPVPTSTPAWQQPKVRDHR